MPRIGAGLGRLKWSAVKGLLQTHFGAIGLLIVVYENFVADVKAEEPSIR